jgi:hypothetical protein
MVPNRSERLNKNVEVVEFSIKEEINNKKYNIIMLKYIYLISTWNIRLKMLIKYYTKH